MSEASQLGASDNGTVVLDIGGDIGALIILAPEAMHLREIEISPADDTAADVFQAEHAHVHSHGDHVHSHAPGRTHVAVRERRSPSGTQYAAIYPGLREGSYTIWNEDGSVADTVRVTGGEVTELDWRS